MSEPSDGPAPSPVPGPGPGSSDDVLGPPERTRRAGPLAVTAAVLAVLLVGGAAVVAWSLWPRGDQPASVLPAATVAYVSVDADPSGAQKVEAFRTLRRVPALADALGVGAEDDPRRLVVEELLAGSGCEVDWADVEPWLGERFALAAVPSSRPEESGVVAGVAPVVVAGVSDRDAAASTLEELAGCAADLGWAFPQDGSGHVVLAPSATVASDVVEAVADGGSLAEDAQFRAWTERAGTDGIATAYVAAGVVPHLLEAFDAAGAAGAGGLPLLTPPTAPGLGAPGGLEGFEGFEGLEGLDGLEGFGTGPGGVPDLGGLGAFLPTPEDLAEQQRQQRERLEEQLAAFEGAAASLRFADGGLDLVAVGSGRHEAGEADGGAVAGLVGDLPTSSAVVLAGTVPDGVVRDLVDGLPGGLGELAGSLLGLDLATLDADLAAATGDAAALVVDGDWDPAAAQDGDLAEVPAGLAVVGDPDQVRPALERLLGPLVGPLRSAVAADRVAVSADGDHAERLVAGGDLGGTDGFDSVVPRLDGVRSLLYLDLDAPWLDRLVDLLAAGTGEEARVRENLAPFADLGLVALDEGAGDWRVELRVRTD